MILWMQISIECTPIGEALYQINPAGFAIQIK